MDPARLTPPRTRPLAGVLTLLAFLCAGGCRPDAETIVLGATTSTYDSGLIEHLIARFHEHHPELGVRTVIAGSGEALRLGRSGDVDLLLVHAPEAEARFIADGHAPERRPILYNGFVIAGPADDPARIRAAASPAEAFARIADGDHLFVSRGDSSGTHYREIALWRAAGVAAPGRSRAGSGGSGTGSQAGAWYIESGQGQATTLHVAAERAAYTLTDEATLAVLADVLALEALVVGHPSLRNVYSVLAPRAATAPGRAAVFANWLASEDGRRAVAEFRVRGRDGPVFLPLSPTEVEGGPPAATDSARGSAARSSPAHHVG